jgi:hypothetical protein
MNTNLLAFLEQIPDPRRKAGTRHPLSALLAMVIMGNLSGLYGYRELARFMQRHAWEFVSLFGFTHGVPNHMTISNILNKVDFEQVGLKFEAWMQSQNLPIEACSLDGKSLKSTLSNYKQNYQDFVAMVQVFCHQSALVHAIESYHNGKQGEAQVVRELISRLELKGAMFTLDALHCQKKH